MVSTFIVNEDTLFNFPEFCDSKYDDENVQKYGVFKIRMAEEFAGQASTLDDFFTHLGTSAQSNIRKSVLVENPNCQELFGLRNLPASQDQKKIFISKSYDPSNFINLEVSPNCCLSVLQEKGGEAFLDHFYDEVKRAPKLRSRQAKKNLSSIRKRAVAKKLKYQKRQAFRNIPSSEGKKRWLEMALIAERVNEKPTECHCDSCDLEYELESNASYESSHKEAFLYCAGIEESHKNYLHITLNFAMAHICHMNMLNDLESIFAGFSFPMLYLGGFHTLFPLHIEDLSTWSFNFLLHGHPKFWIVIPPSHVSQLTDVLQMEGFYGYHKWCRAILIHKFYVPMIRFLKQHKIPYELVIQREGEGVVLLPNAAHFGGNLGPNLAQAANFGTKKWLPYGSVSSNCPCNESDIHADIGELIEIHRPELTKHHLSNTIRNVVEDPYFQKSTSIPSNNFPKIVPGCSCTFTAASTSTTKSKVNCPICEVSWSTRRQSAIVNHLRRHHSNRIAEDIVNEFLAKYIIKME